MEKKIGWVLTVLVGALLLFSSSGKFMELTEESRKGIEHLAIPANLLTPLGILEVCVALLYLIPQTAFIGSILVTGYMGGAIFAHLRVGDPFYIQMAVPIVAWLGFALRNRDKVKALMGFGG